ncbi:MAG: energy transducer TonB, partial [Steroidobacteraceae bacterium]
ALAPGSKHFARQITAAYTPEALGRTLLPQPLDPQAAKRQWAALHEPPCWPVKLFYPGPPSIASMEENQGRVLVRYTVMPDGTARLPRVLYAYPPQVFDATTREAVLRSRYAHAMGAAAPRRCVEWHDFVLQNGAAGPVLVMDGTVSSGFGEAHVSGLTADRMQASEGMKAGSTLYIQNGAPPNSDYKELQYIARKLKIDVDKDNDPRSDLYYGLLIEGAPQLEKSPTSGLTWLVKAAQSGLPLAQFQVGYRLLIGLECRPDLAKALEWLHMAAAQHQTSADLVLAARLLQGTPNAAATARAKEWLEQAVAGGNSYGEMYLAALLATAPDAQLRDPARALSLLKKVYADVHENPTATEIRAAAQAAEGDFAGAVQSERKAIADAGKLGWDLSPLEQRLALYQARKPWHGNLLAF